MSSVVLAPVGSQANSTWPEVSSLQSYKELEDAMRFYETLESRIDNNLDVLISDRARLNDLLDNVDSMLPIVGSVQIEAQELSQRIDNTAQVAERISGQVRQLDEEQSRVTGSIEMVQAVQDLKTAIQSIAASVEKHDWETATRHIQRARAIDPAVLNSSFAGAVVPTSELPQPPPQTLEDFRSSLLTRFMAEFEKASSTRDEANTSRFFKLFPMIGYEKEGLNAYAKFVGTIISGRTKHSSSQSSTSPFFFSSILTPLFEQIAMIISQHQPLVEKYYGQGRMLHVAEVLQEECDRQACSILDNWAEERRITKKLSDARMHRFTFLSSLSSTASALSAANNQSGNATPLTFANAPLNIKALNASLRQVTSSSSAPQASAATGPEEDFVEPREIDAVLTELGHISGRWELYRRFLYSRLTGDEEAEVDDQEVNLASLRQPNNSALQLSTSQLSSPNTSLKATKEEQQADLTLIESSAFRANLNSQLQSVYEPLEHWYLRISIEKAHYLDEPDVTSQPVVSSVLDDTFFLLKKIIGRVVGTGNVVVLASMSRTIRSIMERDFAQVLKKRMESVFTLLGSNQGRADERERREKDARLIYTAYVNNLDLASDYIVRVVSDFLQEQSLEQQYYLESEQRDARQAMKHIQGCEDRFRTVLKSGVDQLFNQLLRPRLRPFILECYKDISYSLDEDGYAESEYNDLVRKRFIRAWESMTHNYRETMTEPNYQLLFGSILSGLVRPWEATVRGMKFTELGGLRYDRDLRSIVSYLSSQTPFGVGVLKDAFARLQQIASLLSTAPEDVAELTTSSGWRLNHAEVSGILALKV